MFGAYRAGTMVLALLAAATCFTAVQAAGRQETERSSSNAAVTANPIRKVVTMLQAMQKKVTEEGEKEKELYEKFACWCKKGSGDLSASIKATQVKSPRVVAEIKEKEVKKATTEEDLATAQDDRASGKSTMAKATALREKEATSFAAVKAEAEANLKALAQAITMIEKGMVGGFLQTSAAKVLHKLALAREEMPSEDRQALMAFLSAPEGVGSGYALSEVSSAYIPQSGQIVGILKQLKDEMAKNFADAEADENAAIDAYEALMAAKKKEVQALTAAVEKKTSQVGELGVQIVEAKNDLSDTEKAMLENQKFLADLDKTCGEKQESWENRTKTRAEELATLAEAIKVLNDDDALDLFKKSLHGSSSFVQLGERSGKTVQANARHMIRALLQQAPQDDRAQLDLIELALQGKSTGFEKVLTMIDHMVATLKKEQGDDDNVKEYCNEAFDSNEDETKSLQRTLSDAESAMADAKEGIASLKTEIADLKAGIKAMDKSVIDATTQRKEENEAFTELMAENSAAKKLLGYVKNLLHKFYNPKLYKAPPKQKLSEEDQTFVNFGGTPPPTEAPGGIAGTGIGVLAEVSTHSRRVAAMLSPEPPTFGGYTKKSAETSGVMSMMDLLIKDLDKEITEAQTAEKDAQRDYEGAMQDSAEKRAADMDVVATKQGAEAKLDEALQDYTERKASSDKMLAAVLEFRAQLHNKCDWLLKYHDVRKEARTSEIESLGRAKAVLSGADYALVEKTVMRRRTAGGFLGHRAA